MNSAEHSTHLYPVRAGELDYVRHHVSAMCADGERSILIVFMSGREGVESRPIALPHTLCVSRPPPKRKV